MVKNILIVDDERDNVQTLKDILEVGQYKVFTARDGESCLRQAKAYPIDLVLLDVMMPGMTTVQILRQLKKIPVMLVTVVRMSDIERRVLLDHKNIVDYIPKPYNLDDLLMRIERFFDKPPKLKQRNL